MKVTARILLLVLPVLVLDACSTESTPIEQAADIVIRNARIWTGDPDQPRASALAIREDRIVAVGGDNLVAGLIGPETDLIDNPAGLVVPGFIAIATCT